MSGASAVEFALLATPYFLLLLGALQVGVYYITQSALDTGVNSEADYLRSQFASAAPTFPNAATLKSAIASKSGTMLTNNSSLAVEIQPLTNLDASNVAIVDGTVNFGGVTSTLVMRAQASVTLLLPGLQALTKVRSSAILRRKGV